MNLQNQQRQQNNDDCCDCKDCQECCDCGGGCCCDDCCKDCECQECGCDCINTIQTNCFDNWQCCTCLQCCTAGDILTELNFNRHIELEEEHETYMTQFKDVINNYKIYKKYKHPVLGEGYLLKRKKQSQNEYEKLVLKTFWFTNQSEYSKQLSIWHQNVFKYPSLHVYGARIQDICIDRWRIAILIPKLHHLTKKHSFQCYTFIYQISGQIMQYGEDKSIFDEQLVFYLTEYSLLPSNILPSPPYQQYKQNNKRAHPPEWEDQNEDVFDWSKSDCFLMGLCVLSKLLQTSIDDIFQNSVLDQAKLKAYIQRLSTTEYYGLILNMLAFDPNDRLSLQQVQMAVKTKPIIPITLNLTMQQTPIKRQQAVSLVSRVQNHNQTTGAIYTGDQIDSKRHGHGKLVNPDGSGYEGEWFQDQFHGKGELFLSDGRTLYKGGFSQGKYHNFGHLINPNPFQIQHLNFRDLRNVGNYWSKYEGDFKQDLKHGYGILYFSNGEKWAGEFYDDIPNGFGTFYGISGEVTGKWVKGILFD